MESKKITKCLLAVYLLALAWMILFKAQLSVAGLPHFRSVNLIPFGASVVTNGTIDFDEIISNLLAFVPFGIFNGMLLEGKSFLKKIIPIFLTSLTFEVLQFIFAIGASDITDLLMNTAGGAVGIALVFGMAKILKSRTTKVLNILCLAGGVLLFLLIGLILIVNL